MPACSEKPELSATSRRGACGLAEFIYVATELSFAGSGADGTVLRLEPLDGSRRRGHLGELVRTPLRIDDLRFALYRLGASR